MLGMFVFLMFFVLFPHCRRYTTELLQNDRFGVGFRTNDAAKNHHQIDERGAT